MTRNSKVGFSVGALVLLVFCMMNLPSSKGVHIETPSETAGHDLIAHEWGTFTSVHSSDGQLMAGLEKEEERLPYFVHSLDPMSGNKGIWPANAEHVRIKMETPVIYFYSPDQKDVDVKVKFVNGVIGQWYPQRFDTGYAERVTENIVKKKGTTNVFDMSTLYTDLIHWKATVLAPSDKRALSSPQQAETPNWIAPRFVDANQVSVNGVVEKFLFYRGLGNFQLPLTISSPADDTVRIQNNAPTDIAFALVYEKTPGKPGRIWWSGKVPGRNGLDVKRPAEEFPADKAQEVYDKAIHKGFRRALINAGLYAKEADAMLEAWRHSYFEQPGIRVFWVVPRQMTDTVLPITITPTPAETERVLVGRSEVMTPGLEAQLVTDFAKCADDPKKANPWLVHRYYPAYKNRVAQLTEK